jgi:hypothetical protein
MRSTNRRTDATYRSRYVVQAARVTEQSIDYSRPLRVFWTGYPTDVNQVTRTDAEAWAKRYAELHHTITCVFFQIVMRYEGRQEVDYEEQVAQF